MDILLIVLFAIFIDLILGVEALMMLLGVGLILFTSHWIMGTFLIIFAIL